MISLPPPAEHDIQRVLVQFLRMTKVNAVWFAVPNGGHRSIAQAKKLKAEGVLAGAPDLVFIGPGGVAYCLEMKTPKGTQRPGQELFQSAVNALGGSYAVARTFDEALAALRAWGLIR